tara:strand:+ start:75 stop:1880 length:1806 start_codon:yes stop_codon:yes gene_type:complete
MLSFKQKILKEDFKNILKEMSIYDPKYPAGTEATVSSAGKNVDKLNKAGMPVNGGDKVVKVQPTNDATLVTIGGGGVVVFLDFNGKVYKLDGKEASISPLFNKSSSGQGITWNVNTLEAAACLGLFMDADIEYEKLGDPNRPTEEDVKIVKKIEKHLTNGQDYDQKGVDGILSILSDPNKRNIADLAETLRLAAGMSIFKKEKLSSEFKYIIHGRIDDYYQAERENDQIQKTGSKLPTPDAVICNKPADTVITALKTQKVDYDEKTGICELPNNIRFVLVSLKKEMGGAQLGKIFKAVKDRYGLDSFEDMLNVALSEGWFKDMLGNVAGVGVKIFKGIKNVFNKLVSKLMGFGSSLKDGLLRRMNKSPVRDLQTLFKKAGIRKPLSEEFLTEASVVPTIKEMTPVELKKISRVIDTEVKKIQSTATKYGHVKFAGNIGLNVTGKENIDDRIKLFTNWITLTSLNSMFAGRTISNAKSIAKEVVELQKEMFFGSTDLPVFKVFGASDKGKPYEYLGSGSKFIEDKIDSISADNIPLIGVQVSSQGGRYYTMYSHFCMGMDEDGSLHYSLNRMGTNKAGGQLSYVFEGYKIIDYSEFQRIYGA